MPLTGKPSHDIPELIDSGRPQKQAVAIALKEERGDALSMPAADLGSTWTGSEQALRRALDQEGASKRYVEEAVAAFQNEKSLSKRKRGDAFPGEPLQGKGPGPHEATAEDCLSAIDSLVEEVNKLGKRVSAADARKYYTLLVDGQIHFGDYDRNVVKQEMEDECDSRGIPKNRCKIIQSGDTQPEIDAAVRAGR